MQFDIGADVGGTFTDLWAADDGGKSQVFESPTTFDVLGEVIDAIPLAFESYQLAFERFCAGIEKFEHGMTAEVTE